MSIAKGQNPLEKWKLENPTTTFVPETNKFTLAYDVGAIDDDNIKIKIYNAKCKHPQDGSVAIEVSDGITVENLGVNDSKGVFDLGLDISKLTENDDVFDNTNPDKPMIKLCARYMLWTPDGRMEVNFIESILTVHFDMKNTELTFSKFATKEFDSSGQAMS